METFLFYVYDTILTISFDGALTDQVTNNALKTSSKLANCYSIGGMLDALRAICGPEMKKSNTNRICAKASYKRPC